LIAVASVISISIRNPSLAIKVEEKKKNVKCVFNAKSNGQFQTVHAHLLCWAKLNHRMDPSTPPKVELIFSYGTTKSALSLSYAEYHIPNRIKLCSTILLSITILPNIYKFTIFKLNSTIEQVAALVFF
jgi:hypothetical protein